MFIETMRPRDKQIFKGEITLLADHSSLSSFHSHRHHLSKLGFDATMPCNLRSAENLVGPCAYFSSFT